MDRDMVSYAWWQQVLCTCINDPHMRNCWIIETFLKIIRYLVFHCHLNKKRECIKLILWSFWTRTAKIVARTVNAFGNKVVDNSEFKIIFSCKNLFYMFAQRWMFRFYTKKCTGSNYSKLWISDDLDISCFLIWYYES